MTELILKAFFAYLLGSVSGSLVVGRIRHVDIRESGSGNAGGTNAFRTQGFWFALGVVIIDVGKGFLAAWLIPGLGSDAGPEELHLVQLACGFAAVVGHCFPIWHGFRGGKGAATAIAALFVIEPAAIPVMLATWLVVLAITGWVGLGTILAAFSLVPMLVLRDAPTSTLAFGVLLALFILFMHRSNVRKMLRGEENRFERARARNWFRRGGS